MQPSEDRESAPLIDRPALGGRVVELDISWLVPSGVSTVEALARLQLAASRCGCVLLLRGAGGGLAELVDLVGLGDVLHLCPAAAS